MLRIVFLEPTEAQADHDCGFDEPQEESHRREIELVVPALGLAPTISAQVIESWTWIATGRGRGARQKGWAARAHRRGLERLAPITETDRANWRELEGVMSEVLRPLEEQFAKILPMFDDLAGLAAPTATDLQRLRALPNTYTTRRQFFERATPAWLPLLDDARVFDQTDDAFTLDVDTEELLPQHWTAGEYLARAGTLPQHQDRFVSIVSRIAIPHERAALDLVRAARTLPTAKAAVLANRFATWVSTQGRVVFISHELGQLAADVGRDPAGIAAASALLETLLRLTPDPRTAARTTA